MVAIFQGLDAWVHLKPDKKHGDVRLVFRIIYNHLFGPIKIYHMADGAEKNITQCSYTGLKRNWIFEKYANLNK